jgi:hypothetical protein
MSIVPNWKLTVSACFQGPMHGWTNETDRGTVETIAKED